MGSEERHWKGVSILVIKSRKALSIWMENQTGRDWRVGAATQQYSVGKSGDYLYWNITTIVIVNITTIKIYHVKKVRDSLSRNCYYTETSNYNININNSYINNI